MQDGEEHAWDWDALHMYACVALDRGLVEDAIKVVLRVLVSKPQDPRGKALLARAVQVRCTALFATWHTNATVA